LGAGGRRFKSGRPDHERIRALLTDRSDSPMVLGRIRDLLVTDPEVAAVGQVASVYVGPHQLPVLVVEQSSEPTPWGVDYWLRRFPDHEQARAESIENS
jgi:hypothetical protein